MTGLRVWRWVGDTTAEGPGRRAAVWVTGCHIRCEGCFNTHLWAPTGSERDAAELAEEIVAAGCDIEGITVLGGEPFEQAPGVAELCRTIRSHGLSTMVFSGFELAHLHGPDAPHGSRELLDACDVLVDGPYLRDRPDHERPWLGSTNQQFRLLTDRYEPKDFEAEDLLEIRLRPDGSVLVNGMAEQAQLTALRHAIRGTA